MRDRRPTSSAVPSIRKAIWQIAFSRNKRKGSKTQLRLRNQGEADVRSRGHVIGLSGVCSSISVAGFDDRMKSLDRIRLDMQII